ncbi:MAG: serine/threonine protein kinase [Thiolinea sp.]
MDEVKDFHHLSPEHILAAVEQGGWVCDGGFLALNSYENRVYQVGIEGEQPLIAKFYRPQRWSDDAILEEHAFTLALAAEEIPVIAPLVDENSHSLHHQNGYRFAMFPRRGGRTPELDDPQQLEIIGRFLARIHALGELDTFNHRPGLDIQSHGSEPAAWLLENKQIPLSLERPYGVLIDDLLAKMQDHFSAAGQYQQLRIHGDCHPNNILWRDGQPHIVDFDDTRMGPAIQDLWMFLSGDRPYQTARLADLLEGYTQFREFPVAELHLIEPLRTLRIIYYAAWLARRADDPAFELAFPWFYTAQFWDQHILALKEQSAELDQLPLVWD